MLLDAKAQHCGISYLGLNLTDVQERHLDSDAVVGPGIFFALSDNKALMAWRQTHPSWRFARVPQDWRRSIPDILSLKARLNLRLSGAELVRSRH
jgi:hypothetical protein